MSLSLCCCISQRQQIRQSLQLRQELRLEQRLEQKLQLALHPPEGWSFQEPDAMKQVETFRGKPVIRISGSELDSYAEALRLMAGVIATHVPDIVLISMRGALPPFRAAMHAVSDGNAERMDGSRWHKKGLSATIPTLLVNGGSMRRLAPTNGKWEGYVRRTDVSFMAIKAETSYFLSDPSDNVKTGLISAFRSMRGPVASVLFIDTSVSGTKLGWFYPQFKEAVANAAIIGRKYIQLVSIILHHGKPELLSLSKSEREGMSQMCSFSEARYDIGVESLITEDSPTLLGVRCSKASVNPDALDVIKACDKPQRASIMIDDTFYDIREEPTKSTALLFARLAGERARAPTADGGRILTLG